MLHALQPAPQLQLLLNSVSPALHELLHGVTLLHCPPHRKKPKARGKKIIMDEIRQKKKKKRPGAQWLQVPLLHCRQEAVVLQARAAWLQSSKRRSSVGVRQRPIVSSIGLK